MEEHGAPCGAGAGLRSSLAETVGALAGPDARRLHFDLVRVMRTGYLFDSFQKDHFVIPGVEDLLVAMEEADLAACCPEPKRLPPAIAGADASPVRAVLRDL